VGTWCSVISVKAGPKVSGGDNASTLGGRPNPTRHSFPHIALGVIDIAFEDDFESITDARVAQRWNCVSNPCVSVADLNAPLINGAPPLIQNTRHGTVCAHIAGGYTPTWGLSRAGGSQSSSFVLMVSSIESAYVRAANRFALSHVDVVSSSLFDTTSTACTATLSMGAAAVNQAALIDGVAWISAAGNQHYHIEHIQLLDNPKRSNRRVLLTGWPSLPRRHALDHRYERCGWSGLHAYRCGWCSWMGYQRSRDELCCTTDRWSGG